MLLDKDGKIEKIIHLTPLWVFSRVYVGSKLASSVLDPANIDVEKLNELKKLSRGALQFRSSPPGIPAPSEFRRMVGA